MKRPVTQSDMNEFWFSLHHQGRLERLVLEFIYDALILNQIFDELHSYNPLNIRGSWIPGLKSFCTKDLQKHKVRLIYAASPNQIHTCIMLNLLLLQTWKVDSCSGNGYQRIASSSSEIWIFRIDMAKLSFVRICTFLSHNMQNFHCNSSCYTAMKDMGFWPIHFVSFSYRNTPSVPIREHYMTHSYRLPRGSICIPTRLTRVLNLSYFPKRKKLKRKCGFLNILHK